MKSLQTHSMNVFKYSMSIGRELDLNKDQLLDLAVASKYHDIGKIKIPKIILYKNSKLNEEEMTVMKKHSLFSYEILKEKGYNKNIIDAVLCHHERIDGKGYNSGLSGDRIPLFSKIISVADSYDAMTSNRPYSNAKSHDHAINELLLNAGTQFDTDIVNLFKDIMNFNDLISDYIALDNL